MNNSLGVLLATIETYKDTDRFTLKQLAGAAGVHYHTVRNHRDRKALPIKQIGHTQWWMKSNNGTNREIDDSISFEPAMFDGLSWSQAANQAIAISLRNSEWNERIKNWLVTVMHNCETMLIQQQNLERYRQLEEILVPIDTPRFDGTRLEQVFDPD